MAMRGEKRKADPQGAIIDMPGLRAVVQYLSKLKNERLQYLRWSKVKIRKNPWYLCLLEDCNIHKCEDLRTIDEHKTHLHVEHKTVSTDETINHFPLVIAHEEKELFSKVFDHELVEKLVQQWREQPYEKRYICLVGSCGFDSSIREFATLVRLTEKHVKKASHNSKSDEVLYLKICIVTRASGLAKFKRPISIRKFETLTRMYGISNQITIREARSSDEEIERSPEEKSAMKNFEKSMGNLSVAVSEPEPSGDPEKNKRNLERGVKGLRKLAASMTQSAVQNYDNPRKRWDELTTKEKFDVKWKLCCLDDCPFKSMNYEKLLTNENLSDHLEAAHYVKVDDARIKFFPAVLAHKETEDCLTLADPSPLWELIRQCVRKGESEQRAICLLENCRLAESVPLFLMGDWKDHSKKSHRKLKDYSVVSLDIVHAEGETSMFDGDSANTLITGTEESQLNQSPKKEKTSRDKTHQELNEENKNDDDGQFIICEICGSPQLQKDFKSHVKECELTKDTRCKICGDQCNSKESLEKHTKEVHANDKYNCPECSQKYSVSQKYKEHLKNEHSKTLCMICEKGFSFSSNKDYIEHLKDVHGINLLQKLEIE